MARPGYRKPRFTPALTMQFVAVSTWSQVLASEGSPWWPRHADASTTAGVRLDPAQTLEICEVEAERGGHEPLE